VPPLLAATYYYVLYVYGRYKKKRDQERVFLFTDIQLDVKTEYNRAAQKRIVFTRTYCGKWKRARHVLSSRRVLLISVARQNQTKQNKRAYDALTIIL